MTQPVPFYYAALAALAAVFAFLSVLARSRFGRALAGIRANERRMRAAGFSTYPYKIAACVIAAMLAGLAGFLKASKDRYVNPELASWHESGAALVMIILGGIGRLRGAVIGAFAFVLLQELYRSDAVFGGLAQRWQLMLGLTIVASVVLSARGAGRSAAAAAAAGGRPMPETLLARRAPDPPVRRAGRGRTTSRSSCGEGEVHAVIGTNGAGKSTLVNVLSGEIAATSGTVELLGRDVTRLPQPRRALAGLGRSYQRSTIFPQLHRPGELPARGASALAAALGVLARRRGDARRRPRGRARRWSAPGSRRRRVCVAGHLSHGKKRQLEIALCLATQPRVLLLDEPLAGMGAAETERMLALLAELKPDHATLLVEHDMDAIFRIADRITVMVDGAAIASDLPERVRANPEVQRAYLGHGH